MQRSRYRFHYPLEALSYACFPRQRCHRLIRSLRLAHAQGARIMREACTDHTPIRSGYIPAYRREVGTYKGQTGCFLTAIQWRSRMRFLPATCYWPQGSALLALLPERNLDPVVVPDVYGLKDGLQNRLRPRSLDLLERFGERFYLFWKGRS